MPSPSKILKTSNASYKVGIDSSKTDCFKTQGGSRQKVSSSKVKKSHPLANTKFYLDIRNRAQLAEVESALKSYGAKIELFFGREVKVVVTDRTEWIGNGQSPSASISPLTTPSPSSIQDQRFVVPKTRAFAMLEKVSRQPVSPYSSPLELAQKWRIPIFPIPSLWKWIAKVEEAFCTKLNDQKKENKIVAHARNSPFIKIESSVSANIPEFLVLGSWPRLNLDGHLGQCPFLSPSISNPSVLDEETKEVENKLFDVKDKVAVELIKYDTDFRIKENVKIGECEEDAEVDKAVSNFESLNRHKSGREDLLAVLLNSLIESVLIFHCFNKMTRRPAKTNSANSEDESTTSVELRQNISTTCNGYTSRSITRQSSQELLKVQCNGLTTSHRNSKLLSPSGSDVLPLPTSRRTTRRASASWCGSTRELSQLSPTDSEIENIRRSESSFEANESPLDTSGISLRPKGQLWLPVALIGTTAEENGNCVRKRYEYSLRQSENCRLAGDLLEAVNEKIDENSIMPRASKESDSSANSNCSSPNEYHIKKNCEKRDTYCIITRNTKVKNCETNGRSRESSVESQKCEQLQPKIRTDGKKRSFSACGRVSPSIKRARTMSTNSIHSLGRKKKLSPEEKLLQDNKEYFKMEVLNTKLRSSGSLLNVNHNKECDTNGENSKPEEKIDKIIIKKIKIKGRRKKSRWTKTSAKKGNDVNYSTIIVENKKNNVKINGVIKKKRQSELMKLCNEAETFMFGESSRQGSMTANATEREVEDSPRKRNTSTLKNKLGNSENSYICNNRGKGIKARRKRRSHAEAFILDNLDYYKFETPGSRLRYQGNFLDVKSEDKDFIYTLRQKRKDRLSTEQNKKNELLEKLQLSVEIKEERLENHEKKKNAFKPSEELEKILFSFESVPETEPWYAVYKRQDEGMENYYPLLSDPNDQPFLLPYELPKPYYPKATTVSEYYKRRRKKLVHLFNHPRKSPRCHASTLAILSSLKRRKRRSGTNISMNAMLAESPPANPSPPSEKFEAKVSESDKNDAGGDEILDLFFNDESDGETEEILLEPFSDSENKPKRKNSDSSKSVKSDDEDAKNSKTCGRSKKLGKVESQSDCDSANDEEKHFLLQTIQPDSFIKDMVIEIRKKSGLSVNISSMLEDFKNCRSMEESDAVSVSDLGASLRTCGQDNRRRKRKKARKINKTGWDNRKSRRRIGNKMTEVKEPESDAVTLKSNCTKKKVKSRQSCINSENIIIGSKRRIRRGGDEAKSLDTEEKKSFDNEDRPVLRSQLEGGNESEVIRRASQDTDSITESADSASQEYPPCVVRVRKISNPNVTSSVKLNCSKGKYSLQKRRLVLRRKKKRVIDYAWSTKRRR